MLSEDKQFYMDKYHTDSDGILILDTDGEPIPKTKCICGAYEPNECCCGAWDDVLDIDYDW